MDTVAVVGIDENSINFVFASFKKQTIWFSSSEAANRARAVILGALSKKAVLLELDNDGKGRIYE